MSSISQFADGATPSNCPKCQELLLIGKPYCPQCGLLVGFSSEHADIRAYVDAKLANELRIQVKDNAGVVRELADKVEGIVWGRLNLYKNIILYFGAGIVALIAFFGVKTYDDAKKSILHRLEPIVARLEKRANEVGSNLDDIQKTRIPAIRISLNQVDIEAKSQKERVEAADGQIARSIAALNMAEAKTTADGQEFSRNTQENKAKLDQITQRSIGQIAQVTRSASQASVVQAYPELGQEPQVVIGNQVVSTKNKRPGEKWVSLVIGSGAKRRGIYTTKQVAQVESALMLKGFRVFTGTVIINGRIGTDFERLGNEIYKEESEVFFYDKSKSAEANDVLNVVSKEGLIIASQPSFVTGNDLPLGFDTALKYFTENSGIDVQVFLGIEKMH